MTACTEKEAAEKWCPHARQMIASWNDRPVMGNTDGVKRSTCIGSRCMQWRWVETMNLRPVGENPRGYCGLAGKP
jgi:hypothetical protein